MFLARNRSVQNKRNKADDENDVWVDNVLDSERPSEERTVTDSSFHSSAGTSRHSVDMTISREEVESMPFMDGTVPGAYSGEVNGAMLPHGSGTAIMTNGDEFYGEWVNGTKRNGTYTWPSGNRYEGEFHNNRFHGIGRYTWGDDGSCYSGNFLNNERHGRGAYTDVTNSSRYSGEYRYGKRHGHGQLTHNGTLKYRGEWRENKTVKEEDRDSAVIEKIANVIPGHSPRVQYGPHGRAVELDFSVCALYLTRLPPESRKLSELRVLDLTGCSLLQDLPRRIGQLENLRTLRLNDCKKLRELPQGIGGLTQLRELILANCKSLKTLPHEIGHLHELIVLVASGCHNLEALPGEIGQLSKLVTLTLGGCPKLKTRTIPNSIKTLSRRNNIHIPTRLNREAETRTGAYPSHRFDWSGPGGLGTSEKRKKDQVLVSMTGSRWKSSTVGGVVNVLSCKRDSTAGRDITFDEVCRRLDHSAHRERWRMQLQKIFDAHDLQHHAVVVEKATAHLEDVSQTLRDMGCLGSGYFPTSATMAYYCRALALAKSEDWEEAIEDATECLCLIQIESKAEITKERHRARPELQVIMLRTRGICLKNLGRYEEALDDLRACCAAIRLQGDRWDRSPPLQEATKELLHTATVPNARERHSRPHYNRKQRAKFERELGIGVFEHARYRCLHCGATPSDSYKIRCCQGCYHAWFCSRGDCRVVGWTEGHKRSCDIVRNQDKTIYLPHWRRISLEEELQDNECVVEVFGGTFLCILQDPTTGQYFDSLSDKAIKFHTEAQSDPTTG